jgi:DNA-directed RNA polymerase specialized sigma24 family protein
MGNGAVEPALVEALPHLWFFALRLTSTSEAAERLVKETYLGLASGRHQMASHVSPRVNMIALMLMLWKEIRLAAGFSKSAAVHIETDCEASRRLLQIIGSLPDNERIAIVLVEAEQLSLSEAAWALGISTVALDRRLERAHTAISNVFGNDAPSCPMRTELSGNLDRVRA